MGYERNHAIVVTSWKKEALISAHAKALALFKGIAPVTEITDEIINGVRSFLVAPDGSKEGWPQSDAGDTARALFIGWLKEQAYEDGSTCLAFVEVQFGDDFKHALLLDASDMMKAKGSKR